MTREDLLKEVSPCGMLCSDCPPYKAKDDPALLQSLLDRGYKPEFLPCPGCREVKGHCPHFGTLCSTYACAEKHEVEFCGDCPEFPCQFLHPAADRANILPHNMKLFNLLTIRRDGLEAWYEHALEIKRRYYTGKITIGDGPQL
jgi:hypothetical protein